jgi:hypothetical protein
MKIQARLPAMILSTLVVLAGCKGSTDSTPTECQNIDFLFDSEPCLEALTARCRAFTTEEDCWGAEPVEVAVDGDYAYCAWTKVAIVADAQTCEIGETFGRCEAALPALPDGAGGHACLDGEVTIEGDYTAFVDDLELVDSTVESPDATAYATLLYWTPSSASTCGENVTPPVPGPPAPEWCSCAAAACLATGD